MKWRKPLATHSIIVTPTPYATKTSFSMNNPCHNILITSGATIEPIDEVRYIENHSSGKLGSHLALEACKQGHRVTLLHGSHAKKPPLHPRLTLIPYRSTRDLEAKLQEFWASSSILIMAAAVADFTPQSGQVIGKLKKEKNTSINLCSTKDLVASVAKNKRNHQRILAFALQTQEKLEHSAKEKLRRKSVDAIIANPLQTMNSDQIEAIIYTAAGQEYQPGVLSKLLFAKWLIKHLDIVLQMPPESL